ncbi:MAG: hypothetical protein H5T86_10720 [Armatimonadetes bacterium]|nr:hypothetical protein [Armatimonadota bacterium]
MREAYTKTSFGGVREVEMPAPGGVLRMKQQVLFAPGGRHRFETIWPRQKAGELIVSDGRELWVYNPRQKTAYVFPAPPPHPWLPPAPPRAGGPWWHQWRVAGQAKIAGRRCHVLVLQSPRGREIARLWIDADKYVVLGARRQSIWHRHAHQWQFEKASFDIPPAVDAFQFKPPPGVRVVRHQVGVIAKGLKEAEAALGMKALVPGKLPEGFNLVPERSSAIQHGARRALWLVFSNRAQTFSIFQSWRLPPHVKLPPGAVARWDVGPYTLIVVGELSREQLEAMRRSLPPPPPAKRAPQGRGQ